MSFTVHLSGSAQLAFTLFLVLYKIQRINKISGSELFDIITNDAVAINYKHLCKIKAANHMATTIKLSRIL